MALVLDLLVCVVRAEVTRDLDRPIERAHLSLRRDEREGLAHVRVGDRAVISVEANVGGFPEATDRTRVGESRVLGKRKKANTLEDERVTNETTIAIGGDLAPAPHAVNPHVELGVEAFHGVEGSAKHASRRSRTRSTRPPFSLPRATAHGLGAK
jgi:hypothetical protein